MRPSPAPAFEASSTALIRLAVEALASDPALTPVQARVRGEAVVCGIMAFLPADPVQTMLASQAVGQHLLVLDTFREIQVRSLSENGSPRMRLAAGTLTRTTLSLMRELRVTRAAHRAAVLEESEALRARAEWEAAEAREAADAREAAEAREAGGRHHGKLQLRLRRPSRRWPSSQHRRPPSRRPPRCCPSNWRPPRCCPPRRCRSGPEWWKPLRPPP